MDAFHAQQMQRAAACVSAQLRDEPAELDVLLTDFDNPSQAADAFFLFADACVTAVSTLTSRNADDVARALTDTGGRAGAEDPRLLAMGARLVRALVDDSKEQRDAAAAEFLDAGEALNAGFTVALVAVRHLGEQTERDPQDWASTFAINAARIGADAEADAEPS